MRKVAFCFLCLTLSFPMFGCNNRSEPTVIEGTGDEITPEMRENEEAGLETTQ